MDFIHFGRRMEIERLYLEWCAEEGIANKPNSMVVFLMEKGWLNQEQIIKDLNEPKTGPQTEHGFSAKAMRSTKLFEAEPQTEYKKWETKPAADLPTENTTCVGVAMYLLNQLDKAEQEKGGVFETDSEHIRAVLEVYAGFEDQPQIEREDN